MKPIRTKDETHLFQAPPDWDKEAYGECGELGVCVSPLDPNDPSSPLTYTSSWAPSHEELDTLNAGGVITVTLVAEQPPLVLGVKPYEPPKKN